MVKGRTHGLCSVKDWTRSDLLANHRICIIRRIGTTQANQFYFCFFLKVCDIFKEFSVKYIASIYLASVYTCCIFSGYVPVDCYRVSSLYFRDVPAIWEHGAHRLLMRRPAIAWQVAWFSDVRGSGSEEAKGTPNDLGRLSIRLEPIWLSLLPCSLFY